MNRIQDEQTEFTPLFLAKARSLSERAARAMCPNGTMPGVASNKTCNVITLQNSNSSNLSGAAESPDLSAGPISRGKANRMGGLERKRRGLPDER